MNTIKYIILGLVALMVLIQFVRPKYNLNDKTNAADFAKAYSVPHNITTILANTCYDCHSNKTRYPWYSKIQPVAWMMQRHIANGKQKLNFSEFGIYSARRQHSKLKEIANSIKDEDMPLTSYKLMHKEANISESTRLMLVIWMEHAADSLSKIDQ